MPWRALESTLWPKPEYLVSSDEGGRSGHDPTCLTKAVS